MSQPANNFTANPDTMLSAATQPSYPPLPTETAPATRVDTAPQQASTAPGDGSVQEVHSKNKDLPSVPVSMSGTGHDATAGEYHTSEKVPFKERVVGVAQKTRGTIFGDSDLKEHGQAIIDGRTTFIDEEDRKH